MKLENNVNNNETSGIAILVLIGFLVIGAIVYFSRQKYKSTKTRKLKETIINDESNLHDYIISNEKSTIDEKSEEIHRNLLQYFDEIREYYFNEYLLNKYVDRFDLEGFDGESTIKEDLYKSLLELNVVSDVGMNIARNTLIELFCEFDEIETDSMKDLTTSALFDVYTRISREMGNKKALDEVQKIITEDVLLNDFISKNLKSLV